MLDGNLDVTFSTEGGYTETKEIINTFNQVLERLRSIDQSRQEFVSNVSHELKTPITSMRVLADSLILGDNVPVDIYREFMQDISDEIDRETKIINDLLTLVRMDKNATELNISQVNINNLVEQILKRVRPIAKTRSIEIIFESFRPVTADVDETKLSLAVTNLVENGVKYNNDGGWVRVSVNADHKYFYKNKKSLRMNLLQLILRDFYKSSIYFTAITSISISAPFGRAPACTQDLAGLLSPNASS